MVGVLSVWFWYGLYERGGHFIAQYFVIASSNHRVDIKSHLQMETIRNNIVAMLITKADSNVPR